MPETVLRTKLFIPPLRPNLVPRPHLIDRLNQGLQAGHKLTLISAPAGFGKTTLVSEWLTGCEQNPACAATAWLSLDEGDGNPTRFLTYLVAALQTLDLREGDGDSPAIGESVLAALQSPQPPPTESILTVLLNEISAAAQNFIIVLDDYHLTDADDIDALISVDAALTFILDHQPPQMHLVITTREDPSLPLPRLRARDQLTELRAADLRFTPDEAAGFLNQVMGLSLSAGKLPHWRSVPKAGSPAYSWRRFLYAGRTIFPALSTLLRETTAMLWTIWWKRSCSANPNACAAFCCAPPF